LALTPFYILEYLKKNVDLILIQDKIKYLYLFFYFKYPYFKNKLKSLEENFTLNIKWFNLHNYFLGY